ncbi:hypothetical protein HPB48_011121 [Haemaphysalis longicornis]|uniref:Uncharacterized protein n=1 Tax=Haemaphysalis longicornis TaxID=44386 RepID=A0A9J6GGN2_HAELO|nr:hypothetical protein HPB48_011121 [Haemaphysalis longicornis]
MDLWREELMLAGRNSYFIVNRATQAYRRIVRAPAPLLREYDIIIVRPREGLDVKNVSQVKGAQALPLAAQLAPAEIADDIQKNARAYSRVESVTVGVANYEVSSYLAAPDNTCKGVVRGVDLDFDAGQLKDMIVQPKNPRALEVKQEEGSASEPSHLCRQTENVTGAGHPRGTLRGATFLLQNPTLPFHGTFAIQKTFPLQGATIPEQTTWVDRVKGLRPSVMGLSSTPPEHSAARIVQLERENASLRNAFEQLKAEIAEMKRAGKALPAQRPIPLETEEVATPMEPEAPVIGKPSKKRSKPIRDEGFDELRAELREFQSELRTTLETLSEAVSALNARVDSVESNVSDVDLASPQAPVQQQKTAPVATAVPAVPSAAATASSTKSGSDTLSTSETAVEAMDVSPSTSAPEASQERRGATGRGKPTKPKASKVAAPGNDPKT